MGWGLDWSDTSPSFPSLNIFTVSVSSKSCEIRVLNIWCTYSLPLIFLLSCVPSLLSVSLSRFEWCQAYKYFIWSFITWCTVPINVCFGRVLQHVIGFFAYTNTLNVIPGIRDLTLETIIILTYCLITDETVITYMTFLICSLSWLTFISCWFCEFSSIPFPFSISNTCLSENSCQYLLPILDCQGNGVQSPQ